MPSYFLHIRTARSRVTTLRAIECEDGADLLRCLSRSLSEFARTEIERVEVCDGPETLLDLSGASLDALFSDRPEA
jgi:hypothetical protein